MAGIVKNRSSIEELNKQVNEMTARIAELLTNPEVYQVDTVEEMLVIDEEETEEKVGVFTKIKNFFTS